MASDEQNDLPVPASPAHQILLADDGEEKEIALGALMGTNFLVPHDGELPELSAVKLLILGLGHIFDQLQDVEWAHGVARARGDAVEGKGLLDTHARFKARATEETFVQLMCGFTHEFLELLHHDRWGCLRKLEAWPSFKQCVDQMPREGQDAWSRLRTPKPAVRDVLRTVRNAGAFHIGETDIGRALMRTAAELPPPFFAHFTFGHDKWAARYIACDLAAQNVRLQATEDAGITWDDLNRTIEDVQALGVHLMPELVTAVSGGEWAARRLS
jgi:hypothetical protein